MGNAKLTLLFIFFTSLLIQSTAFAITVPTKVSVKWLKNNLGEKNLVIIEMSGVADYQFNGHIPGSVYTNKSFWRYIDSDGALVHLPVNKLQQQIRELGINNSSGVIIYYKGNEVNDILGAYYLFWLFHRLGQTNVGMLEQGWQGWLQLNGKIDDIEPEITTGSFVAHPLPALEITTSELNNIRKHYILVDGRPKTHFDGATKFSANPKYGRIPGSVSQPWSDYINKDKSGRFYVITPELPAIFKRTKIEPNQALLLTCLGGTGAAMNYVIFYIAGYHNMRLDDAGLRRWNTRLLPLVNTKKNIKPR